MELHRRRTSSERREGSGRRAAAVSRAGSQSHRMEMRNLSVPVSVGSVGFMKRCSFSFFFLKDRFQKAGRGMIQNCFTFSDDKRSSLFSRIFFLFHLLSSMFFLVFSSHLCCFFSSHLIYIFSDFSFLSSNFLSFLVISRHFILFHLYFLAFFPYVFSSHLLCVLYCFL